MKHSLRTEIAEVIHDGVQAGVADYLGVTGFVPFRETPWGHQEIYLKVADSVIKRLVSK